MSRELLELAAQAVGLDVGPNDFTDEISRKYSEALGLWVRSWPGDPCGSWWNPLNNGDHALQIVTRLDLHVGAEATCVSVWSPSCGKAWFTESYDGNLRANADRAIRRAIVRCAAMTQQAKDERAKTA